MLRGITIAESGMQAAGRRLDAAARNIANMHAMGALPKTGTAPSPRAPYQPVTVVQSSDPTGGTTATEVPVTPAYVPAYDPSSPYADAQGLVAAPNVDLAAELANIEAARQSYLANAELLRVTDEMLKKLYDLADASR